MPTDAVSVTRLMQDARLASFPYARRAEALPEGWSTREDLAAPMRQALGLKSAGVEQGQGVIVDRGSGLTAVLLHRPDSRELVVAFGGTTAGKKVGETIAARVKPGRNFRSTLSQWGANIFAGLGGTPRSYKQASTLLSQLQQRMRSDPTLAGLTLRVVGHSKGAGEAMFAALGAKAPVPVTAFCPAHLSEGLIKQLPACNLARAKELVASYSPYGDPVAAMRGKLPRMPGVGAGYHFDGIPKQGAMHRHDRFHEHVAHWCAGAQAAMAR